jgi:PTH1 family peptidyl-tRNA hydrolase
MKIIFGLGNPGRQYRNNRHNVGYMVLDELASRENFIFKRSFRLSAALARKEINNEEVLFIKPRTYMNNSGLSVKRALSSYKLTLRDILVVYDDIDLPLGKIRFRESGSCAGHRGMAAILSALGDEKISRLRVGISRDELTDVVDYVLSDFSLSEKEILEKVISQAASACIDWVYQGASFVMQQYNSR